MAKAGNVTTMIWKRLFPLLAGFTVASFARPAFAHPLDIGYLRIDQRGTTVSVVLDLDVNAAANLVGLSPRALDTGAVQRNATRLADLTYRRAPITTEAGACRWTAASAALIARTVSLTGQAECASGAKTLRWRFPFLLGPGVSSTFQLLVKVSGSGDESVTIVDKDNPEFELSASTPLGFGEFVWSGIEHIGVAPNQWRDADGLKLPDGIDHILFLLALMLAGGTLLQLVGIATGFTLGHSVTLALSALDVIRPPASVIEPLIALTIALAAAEAFLGVFQKRRWIVASCFGLIHGFGFASALNELELSTGDLVKALFGYNVGVELGQVAIVLVTAPIVIYLQRLPRAQPIVVRAAASMIFLAGMYWFVLRLIG